MINNEGKAGVPAANCLYRNPRTHEGRQDEEGNLLFAQEGTYFKLIVFDFCLDLMSICFMKCQRPRLKQGTVHFIHSAHSHHFNIKFLLTHCLLIVFGNDDFFKAKFFRFSDALINPVHRSYFSA